MHPDIAPTPDSLAVGGGCFVVAGGWPGAAPLQVHAADAAASGARNWQHLDALLQPAELSALAVGVVPCLALRRRDGTTVSVAVPNGQADALAWETLAERAAAALPLSARGPDIPATPGDDTTMLAHCLSHDLRTPIRNSGRLVDAVLGTTVLEPAVRQMLEQARDATLRAADGLDGLVLLLRINRANLTATPLDVTEICTVALRALAAKHSHAAQALSVVRDATACGDLQLVSLALHQLLDNACKFTRHTPSPKVEISVHSVAGFDVVAVSDNGAGFSAAHAQALFSPFQRIHLQSEFPGDGVGLALVRRVAQRHRGWAWADVGTPGWTRFMLALPTTERSNDRAA